MTRRIPEGLRAIPSPLIGMIHLMPLPGSPRWDGSMDAVVERAERDAEALHSAGFDALIVENFLDAPFFSSRVPPETTAAMTRAVLAVAARVPVPVGVNVLRNDASAALSIAAATTAAFVRVNVHTGAMWTDQGIIQGEAADTLRRRARLAPTVAIAADVHVKHATPVPGSTLLDSARDCWERGLADVLVVSGTGTGRATDLEEVRSVKKAIPDARVWIGSGLNSASAAHALRVADGAIVGTSVMNGGRPGTGIDPDRAAAFVEAARD